MILTQLEKFHQALYDCLGLAKDAVFELMDAVLTSPSIPSFVSLSQSPVFRRQCSSIYAALHDSRPPRKKLMKLLVKEVATNEQPFLAGEHSFWSRPEARSIPSILWGKELFWHPRPTKRATCFETIKRATCSSYAYSDSIHDRGVKTK